MAALTRSGARKASEIVILILRTLHRSRYAMISAVIVGVGACYFSLTDPSMPAFSSPRSCSLLPQGGALPAQAARSDDSHT